jgi:hypothetical protein
VAVSASELSEPCEVPEDVSDFVEFPVGSEEEPDEEEESDDESDEPDERDELGESEELDEPEESDAPDVLDESFATPVSTSTSPEFLLSPESGPQVGQAARPLASRSFSATAICCERLA